MVKAQKIDNNEDVIARACRLIEQSDALPDLQELAQATCLSKYQLHRRFKQATGLTPKAYAAECRAMRMRDNLTAGASVIDALFEAGYNAPSRFYAEANKQLGMPPSAYRDGGRDSRIRFAIAQCHLGPILIAATDLGVCNIQMGDDARVMTQDLQNRFPNAELCGSDAAFERVVAYVCAFIESPDAPRALPLDIRGTVFQLRVWRALQKIPLGETMTYAQIAALIGAPKAHRAVAQACAANPVAIAVPCHRVVRTDGSLSGYRWGVARKRELLQREGALDGTGK